MAQSGLHVAVYVKPDHCKHTHDALQADPRCIAHELCVCFEHWTASVSCRRHFVHAVLICAYYLAAFQLHSQVVSELEACSAPRARRVQCEEGLHERSCLGSSAA